MTGREALQALDRFELTWDKKYPMIGTSWRTNWDNLNEFFSYPDDIRRVIYTTNAIESLNYSIKKVMKNKLSFPNSESAMKLIFMALQNISKKWTMPIREWGQALNQFNIMFEGRLPL